MKLFYKKPSLLDKIFIMSVVGLTVVVTVLAAILINAYMKHKNTLTASVIKHDTVWVDSTKTINATLTVYNPGSEEQKTTYRTAWGDSINPTNPQRWFCLGIDKKKELQLKHGDTVIIECEKCPYINGEWLFMDQSYNKGIAELLISNPYEVKLSFKHPCTLTKKYGKKPRLN